METSTWPKRPARNGLARLPFIVHASSAALTPLTGTSASRFRQRHTEPSIRLSALRVNHNARRAPSLFCSCFYFYFWRTPATRHCSSVLHCVLNAFFPPNNRRFSHAELRSRRLGSLNLLPINRDPSVSHSSAWDAAVRFLRHVFTRSRRVAPASRENDA